MTSRASHRTSLRLSFPTYEIEMAIHSYLTQNEPLRLNTSEELDTCELSHVDIDYFHSCLELPTKHPNLASLKHARIFILADSWAKSSHLRPIL